MSEILTRCKDSMEIVREQCKQFLSDDRSTSANVTISRKDIHTAPAVLHSRVVGVSRKY